MLLFCKMSPCSHWHSCLSPRKSRSVENTFSGASGYLHAGQDLCSKNTFCRLTKRVPHIPALLLSPFSTFALQRNFSMSVNSAAVLRLMGKGAGGAAPAGVVRGRGATRGGRGKTRRLTLVLKLTQQKLWPEHLADDSMDVLAKGSRGYPGQPLECLFPVYSPHTSSWPVQVTLLLFGHTCLKPAAVLSLPCAHTHLKKTASVNRQSTEETVATSLKGIQTS